MSTIEILYLIIGTCVVVLTVTIVWFANEAIALVRSARRSSEDVETVTREIKEKVLLVSESLDRAGMAASSVIGIIEDALESIKKKRDKIADGLSLITGAGDFSEKKSKEDEEKKKEKEIDTITKDENKKDEKPLKEEKKETEDESKADDANSTKKESKEK